MPELYNANPIVFTTTRKATRDLGDDFGIDIMPDDAEQDDESNEVEEIDQDEIFDLIRSISDPEHPNTLEELRVVSAEQIQVGRNSVVVEFTPTVPHCGMSTLIGLCIRVRLLRSLPSRFKVDIFLKPGSHNSENSVNKQLNDKERVAAALENNFLLQTLEQCLETASRRGQPAD